MAPSHVTLLGTNEAEVYMYRPEDTLVVEGLYTVQIATNTPDNKTLIGSITSSGQGFFLYPWQKGDDAWRTEWVWGGTGVGFQMARTWGLHCLHTGRNYGITVPPFDDVRYRCAFCGVCAYHSQHQIKCLASPSNCKWITVYCGTLTYLRAQGETLEFLDGI